MSYSKIETVLGTMIFGLPRETPRGMTTARVFGADDVNKIVQTFLDKGHVVIDAARVYCAGDTEDVLGELNLDSTSKGKVQIHSKAFVPLSDENLWKQVNASLSALKREHLDLYYLHVPDNKTPLKETLKAINDLYKEGKIRGFGISNFAAWQVAEICGVCDKEGWLKPSVYQGMYNAITRDVEVELIPCLRNFGIRFYAYNPLAGGVLCGGYKFEDNPTQGRFDTSTNFGVRYRDRFWKKESFEALKKISAACEKHSISVTEASVRWLYKHSMLKPEFGDGVVLGASSPKQLEELLAAVEKSGEPLPDDVVEAYTEGWKLFKPESPPYFRLH